MYRSYTRGFRVPLLVPLLFVAAALAACDDPTHPGEKSPPITISVESADSILYVGESRQLSTTVSNSRADRVSFSSSDTTIVTVDSTGLIQARGAGTAVVRAVSVEDASRRAELPLKVILPYRVDVVSQPTDTMSVPMGLTEKGDVLVFAQSATGASSYLWQQGARRDIPHTGLPVDVNDRGQVLLYAPDRTLWIYHEGTLSEIPTDGRHYGSAVINDSGEVAYVLAPDDPMCGRHCTSAIHVFGGGKAVTLGHGHEVTEWGDAGLVGREPIDSRGNYFTASFGFRRHPGKGVHVQFQRLGLFYPDASAEAVNGHGISVGWSGQSMARSLGPIPKRLPARWDLDGTVTELYRLPDFDWGSAFGIDNEGRSVGYVYRGFYTPEPPVVPVVWYDRTPTMLRDLVSVSEWELDQTALRRMFTNDRGQIALGARKRQSSRYEVLLLTPVPRK